MLRTVMEKINEPVLPFAQFYIDYIMRMQDRAIEAELRPLRNVTDINTIGLLIDHEIKQQRG